MILSLVLPAKSIPKYPAISNKHNLHLITGWARCFTACHHNELQSLDSNCEFILPKSAPCEISILVNQMLESQRLSITQIFYPEQKVYNENLAILL